MKHGKLILNLLTVALLFCSATKINSQTNGHGNYVLDSNPDIEYPVSYKIPSVEEIKSILDREKNYFVISTPYKIINKDTFEEITDFSYPNENAEIDVRTGEFNTWTYTMGVVYSGMDLVYEVTGDKSYLDYAIKNYDFVFDNLPYFRMVKAEFGSNKRQFDRILNMSALDHCGSIGAALIKIYNRHKDERYRNMIDTVAEYISHKQFRLEDGTLARQRPEAQSLWTDDFYMSIPFLAQMGKLTGDNTYYDDAVKQVIQMSERLFIWNKGLYDHGWNAHNENDPKFFWSRANGWAMMAMVELLSVLPEDYKGRDEVIKILRANTRGLAEVQDGTGFWHNMLDKESTYLETSGTAMFTYAITRGINNGWIDYTFASVAIAGWNAIASQVLQNGQVEGICVGTTFANDNVYYFNRPTSVHAMHGYGPVLLAGAEMIKFINNKHFDCILNKAIFVKPTE